jgi:hypothetical protein
MAIYSQSPLEAYGLYARYYQLIRNAYSRYDDNQYARQTDNPEGGGSSKINEEELNITNNYTSTLIKQ